MTTPLIPEVRYPRTPSTLTVPSVVLRPIRELLLRCLQHLDAVETGASRLWSPELQDLFLQLIRIERLLVLAKGFPIARQLREDRRRLHVEFRAAIIQLLARAEGGAL
jgi:hypothetical protein